MSVVVNDEEGAEYSLLDGPRREVMGKVPSPVPPDLRDVDNESMFEYGSRGGSGGACGSWLQRCPLGPPPAPRLP